MFIITIIFCFCLVANDAGIIEFCGDKLKSFNKCIGKKLLDTDLHDDIEFHKILNIELWNRKRIPMRSDFDELIFYNNNYHVLYFVLKHFGRFRRDNSLLQYDAKAMWLDFGTNKGWSVNMSNIMLPNYVDVHGFDSKWKLQGTILSNNDNILPNVRDEIQLHRGYLNQSLPLFLIENPNIQIYGISFNCGFFDDTIYVLNNISSKLIKGILNNYFSK
jgi:hypothetical protein